MHCFDADNAFHSVAIFGSELNPPPNHNPRVNATDKSKTYHTIFGELLDNHAHLIHMCAQHNRSFGGFPSLTEHHQIAHCIGLHAVSIRECSLQDVLAHLIFPAGRPEFRAKCARQGQEFLLFFLHHKRTSPSNCRKK